MSWLRKKIWEEGENYEKNYGKLWELKAKGAWTQEKLSLCQEALQMALQLHSTLSIVLDAINITKDTIDIATNAIDT